MIVVYINSIGVKRVRLYSLSDYEEDLCLAAWPLVRKQLRHLDSILKKIAAESVEAKEIEYSSDKPR